MYLEATCSLNLGLFLASLFTPIDCEAIHSFSLFSVRDTLYFTLVLLAVNKSLVDFYLNTRSF